MPPTACRPRCTPISSTIPTPSWRTPQHTSCVASKGDDPVATALVYESDGAATVQWVGTLPGARTSGLGALVTVWVTNLAFRRNASSVSLQASPMGAPIYLKLGYETVHHHVEYVRMPTRAAETG